MYAMKADTGHDNRPATCDHRPPMVLVIPTESGYKVRCLTCGQIGPERGSTDLALEALMDRLAE